MTLSLSNYSTLVYLLLLFVLNSVFAQPVKLNKQVQIPFDLTKNGHILVKASVNGTEGTFIFDTGAGLNVLFRSFADKVSNLEKTDNLFTGFRSTGEPMTLDLTKSKSLLMNGVNFQDPYFSTIDVDFPGVDGLLSLMPFKNVPFTIDYNNKILTFETKKSIKKLDKKTNSLPIQLYDYGEKALDVAAYVQINDTLKIQVLLDSGSGSDSYWFHSKYLKSLNIDTSTLKQSVIKSEFNPQYSNIFYFSSVSELSDENKISIISNIKSYFVSGLIYEGKTSIKWLGNKITFDIKNRRLLINN